MDEFIRNYDPNTRKNVVEGKRSVLRVTLLKKAVQLPISEIVVGEGKAPPDFEPDEYFKTGDRALENQQGWKIGEALTPNLVEWFRFVQKRLVLGVHGTYLAQKYLYGAVQTYNGMIFKWAQFIKERIH